MVLCKKVGSVYSRDRVFSSLGNLFEVDMNFRRLMGFLVIVAWLVQPAAWATDKVLRVDVRSRPPEMVIDGKQYKGPLLDIIERAAGKIGYRVLFKERRFSQSLELLQKGETDIVPRVVWTSERAKQVDFLGPIGQNDIQIEFLVKPGKEGTIKRFEDLEKLRVGTKEKTAYFERFDKNTTIKKIESFDDDNMTRMFQGGRFDTMIILDRPAVEAALKKNGIKDYAFAEYRYPLSLKIYYGIAKGHKQRAGLQKALVAMAKSGEVKKVYNKYGISISSAK